MDRNDLLRLAIEIDDDDLLEFWLSCVDCDSDLYYTNLIAAAILRSLSEVNNRNSVFTQPPLMVFKFFESTLQQIGSSQLVSMRGGSIPPIKCPLLTPQRTLSVSAATHG